MQKNELFHRFFSSDMVDLKIIQSHWMRAFQPVFRKEFVPTYGFYTGI